jgi:hypothetical protein
VAQSIFTDQGQILIPGAYASYTVAIGSSVLASSGVLVLIGEADAGPDFTKETNLDNNYFGSLNAVQAKYGSGRLVDAYKQCAGGVSSDPAITGGPSLIKLVKTNAGLRATLPILNLAGTAYGTLYDTAYGKLGNQWSYSAIDSPAEVPPGFTVSAVPIGSGTQSYDVRVNGLAKQASSITIANSDTPTTIAASFSTSLGALATIPAVTTGSLAAYGIVGLTVSTSPVATFTTSGTWVTAPAVGYVLKINGSTAATTGSGADGWWIVTSTGTTSFVASKIHDLTLNTTTTVVTYGTGFSAGTFTVWAPISVTLVNTTGSANNVDSQGKSLEVYTALATPVECFYTTGTTTSAGIVGNTTTAVLNTSLVERGVALTFSRISTGTNFVVNAGGKAGVLKIGYKGTSASMVISTTNGITSLTVTVVGGTGNSQSIPDLSIFNTVTDLATYVTNNWPQYTATVSDATAGLSSPLNLGLGTYGIASTGTGLTPGTIKTDAYDVFAGLTASGAISIIPPGGTTYGRVNAGLPAAGVSTPTVGNFSGGTLGGTTEAAFEAALQALTTVDCNFVVPLFSQNASVDATSGYTDSSSTYLIDSVNLYTLKHCVSMSTFQERKNRQCFLSKRDTLATVRNSSATLNAPRASLFFQDVQIGNTFYQPWMGAATAAAMQAAGFYKAIFNKVVSVSGVKQALGDFSDKSRTQVESVLKSGLLVIRNNTGYRFVSDQTTYGTDNNPVWNSIQAIYAADLAALTFANRMETTYVGSSLADINASLALATVDLIAQDLFRAKLIAASDGAPKGYKNAKVSIIGPAMYVELDLFITTALYFVTIKFKVNQITSTASQ